MRPRSIVLALLALVSCLPLWFLLPRYLADADIQRYGSLAQVAAIGPDKYALVVDEYRKTVAQAVGGIGFLGTFLLSVFTFRASEKAKITERFSKALDHLGAVRSKGDEAATEVRIGAIGELEGVGQESSREKVMIISSLTAYLRNYAGLAQANREKASPAVWEKKETQAILTLLARWGIPASTRDELRLTDLDFRRLLLQPGANLGNIRAERSSFDFALLDGVSFKSAVLNRATFRGAKLEGADFTGAELKGRDFVARAADPERWGWRPNYGEFGWNGFCGHAQLKGAILKGADLSTAKMTEEQFNMAVTDSTTKAPASFLPD